MYAPYETEIIDKEIVKLTKKKNPNFLFIDHDMPLIEVQNSYFKTMEKIYGEKYNCNCRHLKSSELKNEKFDKVLFNAWKNGKIICGISAGAVCWFNSCNSDFSSNSIKKFNSLECLGWINIHMTSHCDEEGRYESTKQQLKTNKLVGVMLSNGAALEIVDDKYRILISKSMSNGKNAYSLKCYFVNEKYYEELLPISYKFRNLDELLNKN